MRLQVNLGATVSVCFGLTVQFACSPARSQMVAAVLPLLLSLLVLDVSSSSSSTPGSGGSEYSLAAADVQRIADAIRQVVDNELAEAPLGGQYRPFVAGFIRLAFHACVGDRCVGCLNVNDPSNNGLNASVTALERVRSQSGIAIRRGDLWALAAKVAYDVGVRRAGGSDQEADAVRFRYGRDDCPTAPLSNNSLAYPDKRWGADDTLRYFADRGFAARETTALMGFHTLGVVRDGPSKAIGQWVSTPDSVSNQFYVDLLRLNWTQRATLFNSTPGAAAETVYTWGVGGDAASPRMMINADVAVVRNFSVADNSTGRSHCSAASICAAPSDTLAAAQAFANDSSVWRSEAAAALTKLIERGYGSIGGGAVALREPAAADTMSGSNAGAALRRRSPLALLAAAVAGAALTGGWQFAL